MMSYTTYTANASYNPNGREEEKPLNNAPPYPPIPMLIDTNFLLPPRRLFIQPYTLFFIPISKSENIIFVIIGILIAIRG